jgi:pimeloyl-ACP methyl ester carboxylesterase
MPHLDVPGARVHYEVFGSGTPTTIFAHGLGSSIEDMRPLGSAVSGRRVFLDFRGHGLTQLTGGPRWDYAELADDLAAVADEVGATRCAGVSMGAGAMMRLIAGQPDRFERCVFFLPAARDGRSEGAAQRRWDRLADLVEAGDIDAIAEDLAADLPAGLRTASAVRDKLRSRATSLIGSGGAAALRGVPRHVALEDLAPLACVGARSLVIAEEGDVMHPIEAARALAGALPDARLHVLGNGAVWNDRATVRRLVAGFLNRLDGGE